MTEKRHLELFSEAATSVGAVVVPCFSSAEAASLIAESVCGTTLLPSSPSLERLGLAQLLTEYGANVTGNVCRENAVTAAAGVTGANFAIAETGTVVLESTAEDVRLATTLPEKHFVLLDPAKIVAYSREAIPHLRTLQGKGKSSYLAYITGPSRTADIERVLTIGVHGPKELYIILLADLSDDPLES